jgi:hypothetical protein
MGQFGKEYMSDDVHVFIDLIFNKFLINNKCYDYCAYDFDFAMCH